MNSPRATAPVIERDDPVALRSLLAKANDLVAELRVVVEFYEPANRAVRRADLFADRLRRIGVLS